jgi:hypothetical protein
VITVANPLAGIEEKISAFADDLKASVVPVIHDGAGLLEKFSKSLIVQEVEQLVAPLDPADEAMVAGLIRSLGASAAKIAQLTAPEPAVPVGVDAEPDPA